MKQQTSLTPDEAAQFVALLKKAGINFLSCVTNAAAPCTANINIKITPITTGDPW